MGEGAERTYLAGCGKATPGNPNHCGSNDKPAAAVASALGSAKRTNAM